MTISNASNSELSQAQEPARHQEGKIKYILIGIALLYLALVLLIPAVNVFVQAFQGGVGAFLQALQTPDFIHAAQLTLIIAAIVVPVNTIFGLCAAWAIARHQFPGRALAISIIDLPFSISPVVAGLMIVLLYGRNGWLGPILEAANFRVIFALPGMIIATAFVTLPFVAREVIPVLEEVGTDQEEAARTLGAKDWEIFWRVTLPNIRWGLLYGVILTNARAMGEFGAVAVVSGNIARRTQTLPLFVEESYKQYHTQSAFAAAVILGCLAVVTLVLKEIVERKTRIKDVE
ncbi:sulfate ABC transporter permease subunit CysW [Desertifilum sp. FACHB-1129]|uniref:Sulfate ABC transporter permease subunit CysW n=1 Tax=Desertifilum tharense IPPAS B-1220 TaxID=1781255 RepID=A0A1E5QDR3_9CYAN|nr:MULTISPECIES: sulfate ABC transporter permease subunit CysW [Desertifilum]MDA0209017.1 sulfate ABC transporter permease subunit CysW [Cyanobacteria bacterium FC1]MBD2310499.1 sulfate ABC transporter permease subunit CysW [Desertifilum sp. FACHB-1129]MBD2321951.1 sulfate ABC transporter permease subunit CysW [Desertifilum sp. FACHB-866]MBD2332078.1 sulfate ABC transporter permease subunit CysW [Desertifilum sp. FACHB-868]OEJ72810.1 sulfate ABC transporter permease subunit CysW [Desertifilum 